MSKRKPSRSTLPTRPPSSSFFSNRSTPCAARGEQRGGGEAGDAAADDDDALGALPRHGSAPTRTAGERRPAAGQRCGSSEVMSVLRTARRRAAAASPGRARGRGCAGSPRPGWRAAGRRARRTSRARPRRRGGCRRGRSGMTAAAAARSAATSSRIRSRSASQKRVDVEVREVAAAQRVVVLGEVAQEVELLEGGAEPAGAGREPRRGRDRRARPRRGRRAGTSARRPRRSRRRSARSSRGCGRVVSRSMRIEAKNGSTSSSPIPHGDRGAREGVHDEVAAVAGAAGRAGRRRGARSASARADSVPRPGSGLSTISSATRTRA